MKFHTEQAGLWLKPNTASQLKPDMPQTDIFTSAILLRNSTSAFALHRHTTSNFLVKTVQMALCKIAVGMESKKIKFIQAFCDLLDV